MGFVVGIPAMLRPGLSVFIFIIVHCVSLGACGWCGALTSLPPGAPGTPPLLNAMHLGLHSCSSCLQGPFPGAKQSFLLLRAAGMELAEVSTSCLHFRTECALTTIPPTTLFIQWPSSYPHIRPYTTTSMPPPLHWLC